MRRGEDDADRKKYIKGYIGLVSVNGERENERLDKRNQEKERQ